LNGPTPNSPEDTRISKPIVTMFLNAADSGSHVYLFGPAGSGKTTLVRSYAKSRHKLLAETNSSTDRNLEHFAELTQLSTSSTFTPTIILLDEIDGIKKFNLLQTLLQKSKHQIMLTCNKDWEIPNFIKKECTCIEVPAPRRQDVIKLATDSGFMGTDPIPLDDVPRDFRGVFTLRYHGNKRKVEDNKTETEQIIHGETNIYTPQHLIWLFDNLTQFYKGTDLFVALNVLSKAAITPKSIGALPQSQNGYARFPRYYRRRKEITKEEFSRERSRTNQ